jgi:UDP-N-acetyl-2-amino-2-deoxyglucuronate dehydrogenase
MKNFVIIGPSGYIAKRHLQAIQDLSGVILAYHDIHESDFQGKTDATQYLDSLESLDIFLIQKPVDYLVVCSPNFLHFEHISIGLKADVDVICEKPIVLTMNDFNRLVELEIANSKKVYTIYQLRLHAINATIQEFITAQNISELVYVAHRDQSYLDSWKVDQQKSGGILFNLGIHYFDFLISHFGAIENFSVKDITKLRAEGSLQFNSLSVSWLFSIDPRDVEQFANPVSRIFSLNGQDLDFTQGFDDLHKVSYQKIMQGKGFGLDIARPSIKLLTDLNMDII